MKNNEDRVFWFTHDTDAFLDTKIRDIVYEFGIGAYGIFWIIIEMMAAQPGYKLKCASLSKALFPLCQGKPTKRQGEDGLVNFYDDEGAVLTDEEFFHLAFKRSTIEALLEAMLSNGLLSLDDSGRYYNESLLRRMEKHEEWKRKKVEAGRKGGINSGTSRKTKQPVKHSGSTAEAVVQKNEPNITQHNISSTLSKESVCTHTPISNAPNVKLTEEQINRLSDSYAKKGLNSEDLERGFELLNSQLAKPDYAKKNFDHYACMTRWVVKALLEEKITTQKLDNARNQRKDFKTIELENRRKREAEAPAVADAFFEDLERRRQENTRRIER